MRLLLLLGMLIVCAATTQDLSGKMFIFPRETNTAHVKLSPLKQNFNSVTVCQRCFTDLIRGHVHFSLATPTYSNAFLVYWDGTDKEFEISTMDTTGLFGVEDYKRNTWHSLCTTWDPVSGLVQPWLDGQPSVKKFTRSVSNIRGSLIIMLGQEQDSHGGGFDIKQSFVGMMYDVHMWDYVLSTCEIQNYMDYRSFTPGNVLNWRAMDYQIIGQVLLENRAMVCL
ncbi:mucosal pentraxin-like [Cyprinodon tularosa]|uniref:mucosal pentraxin-like n=1 Tax=Cyprinodon tularosa TaxID=77115 RepID=UPI0018E234A7|nr:mucosal pentraxin-like [Cyprinodon tularosa]